MSCLCWTVGVVRGTVVGPTVIPSPERCVEAVVTSWISGWNTVITCSVRALTQNWTVTVVRSITGWSEGLVTGLK